VKHVVLKVGPETAQILIYASPDGTLRGGMREIIEVYRELWAMGYRPTVPVKFFVRQWAKKKKGPKSLKSLAMATEYNPEQEGEGSVDHCGRSSSSKAISGG
jgi:hypothetical protein